MSEIADLQRATGTHSEASRTTIAPRPDHAFALESRRMDLAAGLLGRFFGTGAAARTSIAGLLVALLTLTGIATMFLETKMPPGDYWKLILPVLTLVLGYLFGKAE